jgi:hypothetical protein
MYLVWTGCPILTNFVILSLSLGDSPSSAVLITWSTRVGVGLCLMVSMLRYNKFSKFEKFLMLILWKSLLAIAYVKCLSLLVCCCLVCQQANTLAVQFACTHVCWERIRNWLTENRELMLLGTFVFCVACLLDFCILRMRKWELMLVCLYFVYNPLNWETKNSCLIYVLMFTENSYILFTLMYCVLLMNCWLFF